MKKIEVTDTDGKLCKPNLSFFFFFLESTEEIRSYIYIYIHICEDFTSYLGMLPDSKSMFFFMTFYFFSVFRRITN